MTITMVFDTETNDMIEFKAPHDDPRQPDLMQLGFTVFEDTYPIYELGGLIHHTGFIKDRRRPVAEGAYNAHHLTWDMCDRYGMDPVRAANEFKYWVSRADRLAAHNAQFDLKEMRSFMARYEISHTMLKKPIVCTMHSSTKVCNIPGKYGPKWPKLIEAYKSLVDPLGFRDAHNASADTQACAAILFALEEKGLPLYHLPPKD